MGNIAFVAFTSIVARVLYRIAIAPGCCNIGILGDDGDVDRDDDENDAEDGNENTGGNVLITCPCDVDTDDDSDDARDVDVDINTGDVCGDGDIDDTDVMDAERDCRVGELMIGVFVDGNDGDVKRIDASGDDGNEDGAIGDVVGEGPVIKLFNESVVWE